MPADDANGPGGRAARIGFFANADDTVRVAYDDPRPSAPQRAWPEETDWPDESEAAEADWPEWAETEPGPGLRSGLIVALVLALVAAIAAAVGWTLTHPKHAAPPVAVAAAPPTATPSAPVAVEAPAPAPTVALPAEPPRASAEPAEAPAPKAKATTRTTKTAVAAAPPPPISAKPGPNCENPQTVSRNLACDPELQAASQRVGRAYMAALAAGIPEDELRREQNDWLVDRDDAARQSPAALAAALRQRADDLNRQRAQALAEPPH